MALMRCAELCAACVLQYKKKSRISAKIYFRRKKRSLRE